MDETYTCYIDFTQSTIEIPLTVIIGTQVYHGRRRREQIFSIAN